jgi:hypothetical protein
MLEFQTLALNRLGIIMVVDYYDDDLGLIVVVSLHLMITMNRGEVLKENRLIKGRGDITV